MEFVKFIMNFAIGCMCYILVCVYIGCGGIGEIIEVLKRFERYLKKVSAPIGRVLRKVIEPVDRFFIKIFTPVCKFFKPVAKPFVWCGRKIKQLGKYLFKLFVLFSKKCEFLLNISINLAIILGITATGIVVIVASMKGFGFGPLLAYVVGLIGIVRWIIRK
ncbi:MAG: hypothetical protein ACRC5M_06725 [Anaeroplasmataceae bacterium]